MDSNVHKQQYYIGWDVGGWNCERNSKSRDAIVILDIHRNIVGHPWRGNLRKTINESRNAEEWLTNLFKLCGLRLDSVHSHITMSIDTPLGFSESFRHLMDGTPFSQPIDNSASNPYLFRATEQYLFSTGLTPLSAIKDMIGSQATKGMHMLARFCNSNDTCGVWTHDDVFTVIEAYPSACKNSNTIDALLQKYVVKEWFDETTFKLNREYGWGVEHDDHFDALICALVGWLFTNQPCDLVQPSQDTSYQEGWIFVPCDALDYQHHQAIYDN